MNDGTIFFHSWKEIENDFQISWRDGGKRWKAVLTNGNLIRISMEVPYLNRYLEMKPRVTSLHFCPNLLAWVVIESNGSICCLSQHRFWYISALLIEQNQDFSFVETAQTISCMTGSCMTGSCMTTSKQRLSDEPLNNQFYIPNFRFHSSVRFCRSSVICGVFNFRSLIAYSMTITHLMPRCWSATWPPGRLHIVCRVRLHIKPPVTASQRTSMVAGPLRDGIIRLESRIQRWSRFSFRKANSLISKIESLKRRIRFLFDGCKMSSNSWKILPQRSSPHSDGWIK